MKIADKTVKLQIVRSCCVPAYSRTAVLPPIRSDFSLSVFFLYDPPLEI